MRLELGQVSGAFIAQLTNSFVQWKREEAGLASHQGPFLALTFPRSPVIIYYVFICYLLCISMAVS